MYLEDEDTKMNSLSKLLRPVGFDDRKSFVLNWIDEKKANTLKDHGGETSSLDVESNRRDPWIKRNIKDEASSKLLKISKDGSTCGSLKAPFERGEDIKKIQSIYLRDKLGDITTRIYLWKEK